MPPGHSKVLGVIPARYQSTRFPGKALARIGTKPMIQWVYEAAQRCPQLQKLVVATDDDRILTAVRSFGGEAVLTHAEHQTGTDRLIEVAQHHPEYDTIVNIQGDEPGIEPELISRTIQLKLKHPEWPVTTAARPFQTSEDPLTPHRVKVVLSRGGRALYFSRSLIPAQRNPDKDSVLLHLGIYVYSKEFLLQFNELPASPLEATESLEQLRVLENDFPMGVHITQSSMPGVDTPDDLANIIHIFKAQGLIP